MAYTIKISSAHMSGAARNYPYVRVAVMEMEENAPAPKMISTRAKGCIRIVKTWEGCRVGKTERAADKQAIAAAKELVEHLEKQSRDQIAAEQNYPETYYAI